MGNHIDDTRDDSDFLRGGGEMGALIRAFPWHTTPLGAPSTWTPPLRTAVRILLSTNHPVFLFLGPDHRCLYNDPYRRSLGPEKHPSMLGRPGAEAWAEIWDVIGPQVAMVMAGEGATWYENQLIPILRHGEVQDVYWTYSYSPIDDASAPHGIAGAIVMVTETTDQVLGNERLRAAERRWQQLFQQTPGFVCILSGPGHVFEFVNDAYCRLVDMPAERLIGRRVADVLPWAEEQGFVALLDSVLAGGEPYQARGTMVHIVSYAGGPMRQRFLDFVYQPIRDEHGQLNGVFVQGSDGTEGHLAQEALRQSEAQLRMARDAAGLGIHDYDIRTGNVVWDARVRELWGVDADEPITVDVFAAGLHPDDRAPTLAALERSKDPAGTGHFGCDYRVIDRRDGSVRWIQATVQVGFEAGEAVRLVGTVLDVTERKLAETRRHEFLATLGHELRNPLAPIANATYLLRRRHPGDEAVTRSYEIIDRQLQHMVRLLEDLLDVVRVANGRIELRNERLLLDDVLRLAVETALPAVHRGGHDLVLAPPDPSLAVSGDPVRLAQVFSNLLVNACKYSEFGSRIDVGTGIDDSGRATVSIRDQGIGIAPAHLSRVFEMFSQAEPSLHRAQGGLGIGLSLAKGLVDLHGGSIEVHSDGLQRGSEFIVRLPRLPRHGTRRSHPRARPCPRTAAGWPVTACWSSTTTATPPNRWRRCWNAMVPWWRSRATDPKRWRWRNRSRPTRPCSTSACPA